MQKKTFSTSLILMLSIAVVATMSIPTANSHTPPWIVKTYAYIDVNPDPVGIGQTAYVTFGIDKVSMTQAEPTAIDGPILQ